MKAQTGRPTVMTQNTVQKLEEALKEGFSVDMACHVSGISRSTYYDHINSNSSFSYKMELAQDWVTQRAKQVVANAIDSGDLKAAQWWLERKARSEFSNPTAQKPEPTIFDKYGEEQVYAQMEQAIKALQEV